MKRPPLGIAPGMTKAQAELCSELALRPRSPLQESAAHAALLDCAQSFSPCVEDTACDTVLLDLTGMGSLFGPLPEISRAIFNRATALGLDANMAMASNAEAAMLAARGILRHYGDSGRQGSRATWSVADGCFVCRSHGSESDAKEQPIACSRRLIAGAFATCARWPRCLKSHSPNVSDKKACGCRVGSWNRFPHSGSCRTAAGI